MVFERVSVNYLELKTQKAIARESRNVYRVKIPKASKAVGGKRGVVGCQKRLTIVPLSIRSRSPH